MIKVGLSAKTPDFSSLVRMLLSHPDVELAWMYNNGNTARVVNLYPELVGLYDGCFAEHPDFDSVDLYIGPYDRLVEGHGNLKAIFSGELPAPAETDTEIVLGLPEFNRKALVRGARRASLPGQTTLLGALALMPFAKNLLLGGTVSGAASFSSKDARWADSASGRFLDSAHTADLLEVLSALQTSFCGKLKVFSFVTSDDVAMLTVSVETAMPLDDVAGIFHDFYDDHRHVVILADPVFPVKAAMVRGTNKAVVSLVPEDGAVTVTVAIDARVRTGSGGALHLLDLLFGLDELTGF